jgi:uncharacterized membrane protein YhhN
MNSAATTATPAFRRLIAPAVACAVIAAMLGGVLGEGADAWQWLHWVAKPLATVLVIVTALAWPPITSRYRRRIVVGLICSLLGDVLLMWPADLFVAGLVAFLIGHLYFISGFLGDSRLGTRPLAWLGCLLLAALNLAWLWPSIPPALRGAVVVYALVLAAMAAQALGRAWSHAGDALARPARRAAIGGALFMLGDSLLAWDRFHGALPLAAVWVLGSYYAAVWFIARSVARDEEVAGVAQASPA